MSFGECAPSFMRKESYKKIEAVADGVLREPWSAFGENYLSVYMAWLNGFFIHSFFSKHWELFLHHRLCHVAGQSTNYMVSQSLSSRNLEFMGKTSFWDLKFEFIFYCYKKFRTQRKHIKKTPKPDFVCQKRTTGWSPLRNETEGAKSRAGMQGDVCPNTGNSMSESQQWLSLLI